MSVKKLRARPRMRQWPNRELAPLSSTPIPLWERMEQGHVALAELNEAICFSVAGDVDLVALNRAIALIGERHPVLIASVQEIDRVPCYCRASNTLRAEYIDLTQNGTKNLQRDEYLSILQGFVWRQIDIGHMLSRALIVKVSAQEYLVCLLVHHLACDGQSENILSYELPKIYEQVVSKRDVINLPKRGTDYIDYLHSYNEWMTTEDAKTQLAQYLKLLAGSSPARLVPDVTLGSSPSLNGNSVGVLIEVLPKSFVDLLQKASRGASTTPFILILAAQSLAIWLDSGLNDFTFRINNANRDDPEALGAVGFFVNTTVLRIVLSENMTLTTLVQAVQKAWLFATDFSHLRFSDLMRVTPDKSLCTDSAVYTLYTRPTNSPAPPQDASLSVNWSPIRVPPNEVALAREASALARQHALLLAELAEGMQVHLMYASSLYSERKIQRFLRDIVNIVGQIQAHPSESLGEVRAAFDASKATEDRAQTRAIDRAQHEQSNAARSI